MTSLAKRWTRQNHHHNAPDDTEAQRLCFWILRKPTPTWWFADSCLGYFTGYFPSSGVSIEGPNAFCWASYVPKNTTAINYSFHGFMNPSNGSRPSPLALNDKGSQIMQYITLVCKNGFLSSSSLPQLNNGICWKDILRFRLAHRLHSEECCAVVNYNRAPVNKCQRSEIGEILCILMVEQLAKGGRLGKESLLHFPVNYCCCNVVRAGGANGCLSCVLLDPLKNTGFIDLIHCYMNWECLLPTHIRTGTVEIQVQSIGNDLLPSATCPVLDWASCCSIGQHCLVIGSKWIDLKLLSWVTGKVNERWWKCVQQRQLVLRAKRVDMYI